ncbi:hypothetical protein Amir_2102 [Actinosynnema mirum DSM 43827]|uniref:Uncharacterized protein n=1 Tax=Actinosynnema mirum (strain ATCC 29888 / DSM 43827 / JCM 3225 / NBRC 14064 / NCIMB 13271 / NRRL B-12336 / IMRU 3971 / 101) TaxID=446462 RepID=C6WGX9_ACTMD|nr:hypothetical protein Amir_2102 [Actinosynnema mirum DSM 43827]
MLSTRAVPPTRAALSTRAALLTRAVLSTRAVPRLTRAAALLAVGAAPLIAGITSATDGARTLAPEVHDGARPTADQHAAPPRPDAPS